jgi:hypothetical protein
MAALLLLLTITAAQDDDIVTPALSGVDTQKIPELARQLLPVINDVLDRQCPELPAVWVVAEIQAESSWKPRARSEDSNGGATGLYQINDANWRAAGGRPGEITVPETHLRVGIPWVCTNLRAVTGHLKATGKPTDPLDAMLVCHIAGCGRVTGSATGVPAVGEGGCGSTCVGLINKYIRNVHRLVEEYRTPPAKPPVDVRAAGPAPSPVAVAAPAVPAAAAPAGAVPAAVPAAAAPAGAVPAGAVPAAVRPPVGGPVVTLGGITSILPAAPPPFTGAVTGCKLDDPTSSGCLTATTRYGLDALVAAFGGLRDSPSVRRTGCWDKHAWNPSSDHSRGKACDIFTGAPGAFAEGDALREGWRVANWYRANADGLRVKYLIWQGRYWQVGSKDVGGGWGERYTGGGVYNTRSATGGHYDHVHVSYRD